MSFNAEIEKPFIETSDKVEQYLLYLKSEKLPHNVINQIIFVLNRYDEIKEHTIPHIKKITGHNFSHRNLFLIIFLYTDIVKIFKELHDQVSNKSIQVEIPESIFSEMCLLRENLLALAFIGDSALETGVIQSIWPKNGSIPKKGTLDKEKKFITVGEEQAKLWDALFPEEQKRTSEKNAKSSQFEAVFGIIYLEGGLEAVENAILALKTYSEKNIPE